MIRSTNCKTFAIPRQRDGRPELVALGYAYDGLTESFPLTFTRVPLVRLRLAIVINRKQW